MFPIRDHNPSAQKPYVTWALIAINIIVFASYFAMSSDHIRMDLFFRTWGLVPAQMVPETFVTSMFLHAGLMHLAGNMLFLWVFGDNMEDQMGHIGFLLFYLLGGLAAEAAQVLSDPGSQLPMVGASGAVAGVMGGYLLLFPKARVDMLFVLVIFFRVFTVPAWLVLCCWFLIQLAQGTLVPSDQSGVAYWAHAGGFAAGLVMTVPLWLRRGGPVYWRRTEGHPPHPEARYRTVTSNVPKVSRHRSSNPWDRR